MDRGKELFKMFSLTIRENLENLTVKNQYAVNLKILRKRIYVRRKRK